MKTPAGVLLVVAVVVIVVGLVVRGERACEAHHAILVDGACVPISGAHGE